MLTSNDGLQAEHGNAISFTWWVESLWEWMSVQIMEEMHFFTDTVILSSIVTSLF